MVHEPKRILKSHDLLSTIGNECMDLQVEFTGPRFPDTIPATLFFTNLIVCQIWATLAYLICIHFFHFFRFCFARKKYFCLFKKSHAQLNGKKKLEIYFNSFINSV